ncbi:protein LTV1 homolog [Hippocampus comes]|uniref:protein LTV1 homolog n=1 Tax=Hippocampus comes TaxID=109280 RepID=UPI00094E703C|nr:PREDICTED: protein LTV1 homolog [Hippocampus comes]
MPHRKKKSFIEKKKALTFHLVHRSQRDPLAADEKAPQHVLLPAAKADAEKRREEQRNFGVFFDDDYDYLQHLKEASGRTELLAARPSPPRLCADDDDDDDDDDARDGEHDADQKERSLPAASIRLPSSVFASDFEEDVGLLNKAAPVSGPRLDMDPDIVAALDEDFDFDDPDNALEDDFMAKANAAGRAPVRGDEDADGDSWEDADDDDDDDGSGSAFSDEEGGSAREFPFDDEETGTRFTDYSMTSSVMRRNEQLTLLDDRFEKFYEQFDEDEIGALDNAELEGYLAPDSARLEEVIKDYFAQKAKEALRPDDLGPKQLPVLQEENEDDDDNEEQEMEMLVVGAPEEKWDCESIISEYHVAPFTAGKKEEAAKPIRVSARTGVPLDVLPAKGPTARRLERMGGIDGADLPRAADLPRRKDESKDQRKARKNAVKEERKERRLEKKANKTAFKEEKARQEKQMLNLRNNVPGLKLS